MFRKPGQATSNCWHVVAVGRPPVQGEGSFSAVTVPKTGLDAAREEAHQKQQNIETIVTTRKRDFM
jgi:hypothetical protein